MVFTVWLLLSCRAQDLGISLPPKGREGITQQDIQRDLFLAQSTTGTKWLMKRMKQMGRSSYTAEQGLCFGSQKKKRVVTVAGEDLAAALGQAVLVSLAKSMHNTQDSIDLCVYREPPKQKEWWLQDLSGHKFVYKEHVVFTRKPVQSASSMDFRILRDEVKKFAKILGVP